MYRTLRIALRILKSLGAHRTSPLNRQSPTIDDRFWLGDYSISPDDLVYLANSGINHFGPDQPKLSASYVLAMMFGLPITRGDLRTAEDPLAMVMSQIKTVLA